MSPFNTISPEKLARLIGTPKCPLLIDVRTDEDFASDPRLIPGSRRRPFDTVAELEQVLGMRPALYAAAAPHLTVHTGRAMPDAGFADAVVRKAMGLGPPAAPIDPDAPPPPGSGTYSIDSRARLTDGRSTRLSVVLRMGGNGLPGSTYTTLHWQAEGAAK